MKQNLRTKTIFTFWINLTSSQLFTNFAQPHFIAPNINCHKSGTHQPKSFLKGWNLFPYCFPTISADRLKGLSDMILFYLLFPPTGWRDSLTGFRGWIQDVQDFIYFKRRFFLSCDLCYINLFSSPSSLYLVCIWEVLYCSDSCLFQFH